METIIGIILYEQTKLFLLLMSLFRGWELIYDLCFDLNAINISAVLGTQRLLLHNFSDGEAEMKVLWKHLLDKTNAKIKDAKTLSGYLLSWLILLYFKVYLFYNAFLCSSSVIIA